MLLDRERSLRLSTSCAARRASEDDARGVAVVDTACVGRPWACMVSLNVRAHQLTSAETHSPAPSDVLKPVDCGPRLFDGPAPSKPPHINVPSQTQLHRRPSSSSSSAWSRHAVCVRFNPQISTSGSQNHRISHSKCSEEHGPLVLHVAPRALPLQPSSWHWCNWLRLSHWRPPAGARLPIEGHASSRESSAGPAITTCATAATRGTATRERGRTCSARKVTIRL